MTANHRTSPRDHVWPGPLPLRIAGYGTDWEWPDELILSVRCIVVVDDRFIMCTNRDGSHAWPGGRREPGETYPDTAVREVHEETGHVLDRDSLTHLGWLHDDHRSPMAPGSTWPHPDFVQVVFAGRAASRDQADWTDTEGYELSSRLVTMDEAVQYMEDNPVCITFMRRAAAALEPSG